MNVTTKTLDLGCGVMPRNPYKCAETYGVDIRDDLPNNIKSADLAVEKIPYPDDFFNVVTAFDFIEHVPRIIYNPNRRFCFVELMNEIYRVLQPNGIFLSYTPAFPHDAVFRDPTHVNIITVETFPLYFDAKYKMAGMYGFRGNFEIVSQKWAANKINLVSVLRKKIDSSPR
jgi:SAM-dependent methyltransferase